MRPSQTAEAVAGLALAPDMLANIQVRLSLLDRLAFDAAFRKPESPWLVLPGDTPETATLFSLADHRSASVRVLGLGPDHLVLGSSSSRGWLVTADAFARMCLVNPVTGQRRALPAIDTIPCVDVHTQPGGSLFSLDLKRFIRGPPPYRDGAISMTPDAMRRRFYRKVVLSDSAAVAMLLTELRYGAAAFATVEGYAWRLAPSRHGVAKAGTESVMWPMGPSRDGIEDAVYHAGKFYSITCSGEVEAWEQDADASTGEFSSAVVAPGLLLPPPSRDHRKYLVAAPDGRLMVVLKEFDETTRRWWTSRPPSFKVHVLDDTGGQQWKETDDIGDAALFVGINETLCVSTKERPELRSGCIYYIEEDGQHGVSSIRAFSLKDGTVEEVSGLGPYRSWPPPAWFTPCASRHRRYDDFFGIFCWVD